MSEVQECAVPWGGDYWGEQIQKRRAWIAEIVCNGTVEFESPAHLLTTCTMLDEWITNGHKEGVNLSDAGGNVSQLKPRPR